MSLLVRGSQVPTSADGRVSGRYVLPGGVDPHTHLAPRLGSATPTTDDFSGPDIGSLLHRTRPLRQYEPTGDRES
jgi:hypothetical protein